MVNIIFWQLLFLDRDLGHLMHEWVLIPVKQTQTSWVSCHSRVYNSMYADWAFKIPLAKRMSAMPSAVCIQHVYFCMVNVNMWHTESIDKNIFEVLQQSRFFDVAAGLCTGGLPQCQQRGSAEFMTSSCPVVCNSTHSLDLPLELIHLDLTYIGLKWTVEWIMCICMLNCRTMWQIYAKPYIK